MKNKDIKKLLKEEANKAQIPSYTNQILSKVDLSKVSMQETIQKPKRIRLHYAYYAFGGLAIACLLILLLVKINNPKNPPINSPIGSSKINEVYAKQMYSLASITADSGSYKLAYTEEEEMAIVEDVDKYMLTIDNIFNSDRFTYEVVLNTNSKYSYDNYLTVTYLGNIHYEMYYTEIPYNDDDDRDYDEINTYLEGILIIDSNEYQIKGFKEIENDESEFEMKIVYSDGYYTKVSQELEIDENDYEFEFYRNNKRYSEVSIECEFDENKVELQIDDNEYELNYNNNGYLLYLDDDTVTITFENGQFKYQFRHSNNNYFVGNKKNI